MHIARVGASLTSARRSNARNWPLSSRLQRAFSDSRLYCTLESMQCTLTPSPAHDDRRAEVAVRRRLWGPELTAGQVVPGCGA